MSKYANASSEYVVQVVNKAQVHFHDIRNYPFCLSVIFLHQSREGSFLSHEARQDQDL